MASGRSFAVVDELDRLHCSSVAALRDALACFIEKGARPDEAARVGGGPHSRKLRAFNEPPFR